MRHGAHHEHQGRWAHEQHVTAPGLVEQVAVLGDRGHERGFDRHEHENAIERLQPIQRGVIAFPQSSQMGAHRIEMALQMSRARLFIGRCDPIVIRVERDLGIDHQAAIAGQMDDHVGLGAGAILSHTAVLNHIPMTPLQPC